MSQMLNQQQYLYPQQVVAPVGQLQQQPAPRPRSRAVAIVDPITNSIVDPKAPAPAKLEEAIPEVVRYFFYSAS